MLLFPIEHYKLPHGNRSSNNLVIRASKPCSTDFRCARVSSWRCWLASSQSCRNCINSSSTLLRLWGGVCMVVGAVAGVDAVSAKTVTLWQCLSASGLRASTPDIPTTGKTIFSTASFHSCFLLYSGLLEFLGHGVLLHQVDQKQCLVLAEALICWHGYGWWWWAGCSISLLLATV